MPLARAEHVSGEAPARPGQRRLALGVGLGAVVAVVALVVGLRRGGEPAPADVPNVPPAVETPKAGLPRPAMEAPANPAPVSNAERLQPMAPAVALPAESTPAVAETPTAPASSRPPRPAAKDRIRPKDSRTTPAPAASRKLIID
jgi:hypothetical protein